ncbi:MAG: pyruvate kinase [Alphaproteobacteria bacterium]|nr:MAG: pyruvate kinase [Alphaproteobacteria bacterium]
MTIKRNRHTKILATLGPSSDTKETLLNLVKAGMDNVRMNFSHGTHADHKRRFDMIREIEAETGRPIGIIADMQGPKLRVGHFKNKSISLTEGQNFTFDLNDAPGDETRVQLPHPEIINAVNIGDRLLMDDGKVRAIINDKGSDFLSVTIEAGTKLSNNKGVNVPNVELPIPALTEKDKIDLEAALDLGADWIAQSFVQRPEDVKEAQNLINGRAKLIVKLEKPSALEYLDEILELTDAVMVARGDLGVEIPPENVPAAQKRIIRACRALGKPVIVATQMLESMIEAPQPTRAEASDVATAIYDGADCVMLSAETAAGNYPIEAVSMMDRIATSVEQDDLYRKIMDADHPKTLGNNASDSITAAAYQVAMDVNAAAIVNYTTSGSTALRTARHRPTVPVLCLTESEQTARHLCLSYGVRPVVTIDVDNFDDMVSRASRIIRTKNLADKNDAIVITAGVPFGTPGSTNILRIASVE